MSAKEVYKSGDCRQALLLPQERRTPAKHLNCLSRSGVRRSCRNCCSASWKWLGSAAPRQSSSQHDRLMFGLAAHRLGSGQAGALKHICE